MKELSIEEKAKRYDEALERAKKLQETCDSTAVVGWCEYIFPELKESEDERIRKALISFLKSPFVNENITDEHVAPWIAWLEKQGETSPVLSNSSNIGKDEQKPAWSKEDEKIINGLINSLTRISLNTRTDSTSPNYSFYKEIDWLKSLKDRVQPRQEWSEEDKRIFKN